MIEIISKQRILVEGAAGLAMAGFKQIESEYCSKKVAVVLCGGNIDIEKLRKALT